LSILDNGETYPAKVLDITEDNILEAFNNHAMNVSNVHLAIGMPHKHSVHHLMISAFKNLACASFASGFGFKEADKLANAAASSVAVAAPAGGAKVEAKKEEVVEEEEDDAIDGAFDLFG